MKTILVLVLNFAAWVFVIACGVSAGTPLWLQQAGWALLAIYLAGGSLHLLLKPRHAGQRWGQAGLFPRSWRRWFLDEPDEGGPA